MSRIGRMPIAIPAGVTVDVAENNKVTVKGPKGELTRVLPSEMEIKVEGAEVLVSRPNDLKKMKSLHGLTRTLINNMVVGVTEGYVKKLEVNGVGYKAAKAGKKLTKSANNYGPFIALMLFVGIPLPGTGAWTGTLAASMLDLDKKKSSVAVMIGVVMAGLIMLLISYLGSIGINSIGDLFNSLFH